MFRNIFPADKGGTAVTSSVKIGAPSSFREGRKEGRKEKKLLRVAYDSHIVYCFKSIA